MSARYSETDLIRSICLESLHDFVREFWTCVESADFVDNWHVHAICDHLQAVTEGKISKLLINIPPGCSKSLLVSVFWPMWEWARDPTVRWFFASYDQRLSTRDSVKCRALIGSTKFQKLWGDKFVITKDQNQKTYYETDKGGYRLATSVGGHGTGEHPDRIVVDDPHNVKEAESEVERQSTLDWWDLTMSSRGVSREVRRVIIMQRLHHQDLAASVLAKGDFVHICLPMRFEKDRMQPTPLGWTDPRTVEGELLTPEQFTEEMVAELEKSLGPYGCNPFEAPILMADLSQKPIGEVVVGDVIIGFDKKKRDDTYGRLKLTKTSVVAVHKRMSPVVKMVLDSGETIRCTADHRWFAKDRGPERDMYLPVTLGRSKLARICPSRFPEVVAEDQRLAGWLSGFFDDEGTVSAGKRNGRGNYRPTFSICFYQGSGRNLPLCEKLEFALQHFGFEFTVSEDERKDNKTAACYGYRCYRIVNRDLTTVQRFVRIVQPTKWRERLLDSVLGAKFIKGRENVVSIEPDGEEAVYALTTGTGNYVVWGLASSNSAGQLQQRPAPKGGGMFKDIYFNQRVKAAPYHAKRIRYWDRAATADGGCYTAGVLMARGDDGNYYVEHVVHGQWEPDERNQKMRATALRDRSRYGPKDDPIIYVEAEGGSSGKDSWKGVARALAGFYVKEDQPTGSKDARAEPWSSQLAARNVYIVEDGTWDVEGYVQEHILFRPEPGKRLGKYKDQVDASSGGFNLLANAQVAGTVRTYRGRSGKSNLPRIAVCSRDELANLVIDDHRTLLISLRNPPETALPEGIFETGPLLHALGKLLDSLILHFADMDPADFQERWQDLIPPYDQPAEKLIMRQEDGKRLWSFMLRKRDPAAEVYVIQDDGGSDRRALSLAYALADILRLPRNTCIYKVSDHDWKATAEDKPGNPHVYAATRAARASVI